MYAADIQDKTPMEVAKYYKTFQEKWQTLAGSFHVFYSHNRADSSISVAIRASQNCCANQRGRTKTEQTGQSRIAPDAEDQLCALPDARA